MQRRGGGNRTFQIFNRGRTVLKHVWWKSEVKIAAGFRQSGCDIVEKLLTREADAHESDKE